MYFAPSTCHADIFNRYMHLTLSQVNSKCTAFIHRSSKCVNSSQCFHTPSPIHLLTHTLQLCLYRIFCLTTFSITHSHTHTHVKTLEFSVLPIRRSVLYCNGRSVQNHCQTFLSIFYLNLSSLD